MSNKEFCESGKHIYKERDVVTSLFDAYSDARKKLWVVVCCDKCDSKFLREVERLL